jgi:hypothetical protein
MSKVIELCAGRQFQVSFTEAAHTAWQKADPRERARCEKWMRLYCDDGHALLDKTKLRNEGKFHTGGKTGVSISILAFKAWQLRAYGGVVDGNHFIVTEVDTSKKQDAADKGMLQRAAEKLSSYLEKKK